MNFLQRATTLKELKGRPVLTRHPPGKEQECLNLDPKSYRWENLCSRLLERNLREGREDQSSRKMKRRFDEDDTILLSGHQRW